MDLKEFEELTRLWILRALHCNDAIFRFVRKIDFEDNSVARFLNLYNWLGESPDIKTPKWNRKSIIEEIKQLRSEAELKNDNPRGPKNFEDNLDLLAKIYGLHEIEKKIVRLKVIEWKGYQLGNVVLGVCGPQGRQGQIELMATMLNETPEKIQPFVTPDARLFRLKLAKWYDGRDSLTQIQFENAELADRICNIKCHADDIIRDVAKITGPTKLSFRDYPHLKETLDPLRKHIKKALKTHERGINIFLYGPPGTGKSELSKVIARDMRAQLFEITCEDEDGEAVRPVNRMDAMVRAIEVLRGRRALLVFDEAEDIFSSASFFSKSLASERKGWTNRTLENNAVPIIWIANDIRRLDPAFSRRFDFIFEVKAPPRHQRKRLYRKICGRHTTPELIDKIAASDDLTPAVVARAKKVASETCPPGDRSAFKKIFEDRLQQTLKAQGHDSKAFMKSHTKVPDVYGLDYLNCPKDLSSMAPSLKQQPDCRICLYGPPGTGKTTLGHWLSKETNRPIHVKKASDLLTPYLGETEQALAEAFECASQDGAILMIDEVDSFLQDRQTAQRSWEVQQVNELLTQMENFHGTFIASTNLIDGIDPAAFRRFDFKLKFDYLREDQISNLLHSHIAQLSLRGSRNEAAREVVHLSNCTPGDFANVRRQHKFQRFSGATDFARAILEECEMKPKASGRKLGFL